MGLSISQNQCMDHLNRFMKDPTKVWTVVKGAAGTGKTFMMNEFLSSLSVAKCVSAPTHKAARVIEAATGIHAETLHSLHGLRPNFNINNFKVGNMQFDPMGEQRLGNYAVHVIDECSQIPKAIHELTISRAKKLNVKIIYIGDPYQLPPIKENNISASFRTDYSFELNVQMRQAEDNRLLQLLTLLREDIQRGSYRINNSLIKLAKNEIRDMDTGVQSLTNLAKNNLFDKHFSDVSTIRTTRYTAWRRDTISQTNIEIRNRLFPNAEGILVVGDVITGYKTLLDQFMTTTLVNSDDYMITEVRYRTDAHKIDCCMCTLQNLDTKVNYKVNIVDHQSETYGKIFIPVILALHSRASNATGANKRKYWNKYYEFKDAHLTMNDIIINTSDGNKHDTIQKELDYGYALTTHKLQGSTVNDIIVNLKDFQLDNSQFRFKNNLLYTALSRARFRGYTIY